MPIRDRLSDAADRLRSTYSRQLYKVDLKSPNTGEGLSENVKTGLRRDLAAAERAARRRASDAPDRLRGGTRAALERVGEAEIGEPQARDDDVAENAQRSATMADPVGVSLMPVTGAEETDRFASGDADDTGALAVEGATVAGTRDDGTMEDLVLGLGGGEDEQSMQEFVLGGADAAAEDDDPLAVEDSLVWGDE